MNKQPPSALKNIRALLFDLGNVLIDVDFERCARLWSEHSGVPVETLAARFRVDAAYEAFECGDITGDAYFDALRRQLRVDLPDDILRRGWHAVIRDEKPGIRQCLTRLKGRFPLYVMTNTNPEHERIWAEVHQELLAHFDGVFVSSRMGCRKPEARAYRKVAQATGRPCSQILFFDDSEENIQGAARCGMAGVLVDSNETIRQWTERLLGVKDD